MKVRHTAAALAAATILASAGAYAQAPAPAANDATPVAGAKITLDAAVKAAEAHVQGKAAKAEYERQKGGQYVYDVEVVSGAKVFDVKIDAEKGTVLTSKEDQADADDGGDEAD
ncbi:PepSY domain-containing protein [Methylobacterium sp. DCY52]|jgi:uncharacterized membrane protein YkoI|uniref:PepSY domain-containing protein n=1 Tax=Methylobacterium sp. DCY52 TaxID=739139 RepID=UPI0031452AEE